VVAILALKALDHLKVIKLETLGTNIPCNSNRFSGPRIEILVNAVVIVIELARIAIDNFVHKIFKLIIQYVSFIEPSKMESEHAVGDLNKNTKNGQYDGPA
jgi:hypothetical protein